MKAWLSRQRDGNYMLTAYRPVRAKITGLDNTEDLYVRYGDPLGVRNLCAQGILMISGIELGLHESVQVNIQLGVET